MRASTPKAQLLKPARPMQGAFGVWMRENKQLIQASMGPDTTSFQTAASAVWKRLSAGERKPYEEKYRKEWDAHLADLKQWQEEAEADGSKRCSLCLRNSTQTAWRHQQGADGIARGNRCRDCAYNVELLVQREQAPLKTSSQVWNEMAKDDGLRQRVLALTEGMRATPQKVLLASKPEVASCEQVSLLIEGPSLDWDAKAGTLTPASLSTVSPGTLRIRPTFEQQLSMSHRHAGTLAEDIHRDLSRSQFTLDDSLRRRLRDQLTVERPSSNRKRKRDEAQSESYG